VSHIVTQRNRLDQILVESEGSSDGSSNLRDFESVSHPRPVMITCGVDENLSLVLKPTKRLAVQNSISIPLKASSN
jgi:hypothetical protein